MTEVRCQMSDDRCQKTRGWRTDARFMVSGVSPVAGQKKAAGLIEKETMKSE